MRNFFYSERGIIHPLLLLTVVGLLVYLLIVGVAPLRTGLLASFFPKDPASASNTFTDNFDGSPAIPQPFNENPASANWDIAVQSRDHQTWEKLEEMDAHHGSDCAPPIDSAGNLVRHHISGSYEQSVFKCKDHLMTSIKAEGYGVIYLTPNQIVDFTDNETVIKVDVTTLRTSGRDWWDIWVTPYEDNLQMPFNMGDVDLNGVPKNAVHISNDGNANGAGTGFHANIYKNFNDTNEFKAFSGDYNWWTGYESLMKVSPQKRTTFEMRLSKNHLKFCIPGGQVDQDNKPINGGAEFCWIDKEISPLTWSKGIVQFGHHSYNPEKDCTADPSGKSCSANTWHWDSVSMTNATPFTIIKANKRMVDGSIGNDTVTFNAPAPDNAFMRFSAIGKVEYSLNNGLNWQLAPKQQSSSLVQNTYHYEHLTSYFVPVPAGTTTVKFKFSKDSWYQGPYQAKDFALWSQDNSTTQPIPSISPTSTPSATLLPTIAPSPTAIPTIAPTATPTAIPTIKPTPTVKPTQTPRPTPTPTPIATFESSASFSQKEAFAGSKVKLTSKVKASAKTTVLIDIEIFDQQGNKIMQKVYDNQGFSANQEKSYSFDWTLPQDPNGQYRAKIGVFGKGWTGMLAWNDAAAQIVTPAITGSFKGEYFNNKTLTGNPVFVREDEQINYNWGAGGPAAVVNADNFSVRWTKTINFEAGTYQFSERGDDGVRVFIDNVRVYNRWSDQAATTRTFTKALTAGNHTIRVEYYENRGLSEIQFGWIKR